MSNRKKKSSGGALAVALVLVIIVVGLFVVLRSCGKDEPEPTTAPLPTVTGNSDATPIPSPTPTITLPPTAEPSPTPEPTPEPTEEPAPPEAASGSFRSDTGTKLNTIVDWQAVPEADGSVTVTLTLSAESYSMNCKAIQNGASTVIDGKTYTFSTAEIDYDGDEMAVNELGTVSVNLPLPEDGTLSVPAAVTWAFRGSYGGEELEGIEAAGLITLG